MKEERSLTAIDLFSGCGGMTYGLRKAGFAVVGALELDSVAAATFRMNHPNVKLKEADIRLVDIGSWMKELRFKEGDLDLLAGCPPCQGFSRLRTLNGVKSNKDRRNWLVMEVAKCVGLFKPKSVMIENVPGLVNRAVFREFLRFLRREGYMPSWKILDAADYAVPQRRKRLVVIAGRGFCIDFGKSSRTKKTVRSAIGNLPMPGNSGDLLHDMPEKRTPEMREWISAVPQNGGGRLDLPMEVQRPCHQRSDGFRDVYGRMAWDQPAPTITGGCFNPSKGRFLHPEQDRNITMREAALLQSFPKSFRVPSHTTKTAAALMIGNALPPEFVRRHAREINRAIMSGEAGGII